MTEPRGGGAALDTICDLVATDEVDAITGLTLDLHAEESFDAGPPYGRCSYELTARNLVAASISARALAGTGVVSPEEWWDRNLEPLEDAAGVIAVREVPALGDHGYLATSDDKVDVLWFPDSSTYIEARVYARGRGTAPAPPRAEVERMAMELSELFDERLAPHLPLPTPETD